MADPIRILILEDNTADAELAQLEIERGGIEAVFRRISTREAFLEALETFQPQLVLADYSLPRFTGMEALGLLHQRSPDVPLIIVTGALSEEIAVECMVRGAADYVLKTHLAKLAPTVLRVLERQADHRARRETDEALSRERERAQHYLDVAEVVIVSVDADHRIVLINRKGCQLLGYDECELVGRNWFETCIPKGMRGEVEEVFDRIVHGQMQALEYHENPIVTRDGREVLVAWHNAILRDESGAISGTLSSGVDITEQRRAEQALRESEAKYSALMRYAGDAILLTDEQGSIFEANPRAESLLGLTAAELQGGNVLECHAESERLRVSSYFQRAVKSGFPTLYESQLVRRDGTSVPAELLLNAFEYLGRRRIRVVVRDITERRSAELRRENVIRDMTHKIKTPIATAQMACDLLAESEQQGDEELRKRSIALVTGGVTRLREDVNRIMEFFRIALREAGEVREPVSLRGVAEDVIREEQALAADRRLRFELRVSAEADLVMVEKLDLYTLLGNLVSNAVKFTREGRISVDATRDGSRVRITVADNGVGIPADALPRVFERFYQVNAAVEGLGLGLPICKEITDRYQGEIEVRSEGLGKGAQAIVELPAAEAPAEAG